MSTHSATSGTEIRPVNLKNRVLAAGLAWLFPGLGHFYQGRNFKAALFFLCLVPLLGAGLWMGSYWDEGTPQSAAAKLAYVNAEESESASFEFSGRHLRPAQNAYYQWNGEGKRLYFIPQAFTGVIAVPAYLQAKRVQSGRDPLWNGAFAPPAAEYDPSIGPSHRPTLNELLLRLHSWFDLGTIFIAVAGLLNLLVIFDAFCGPAWSLPEESDSELEKME